MSFHLIKETLICFNMYGVHYFAFNYILPFFNTYEIWKTQKFECSAQGFGAVCVVKGKMVANIIIKEKISKQISREM